MYGGSDLAEVIARLTENAVTNGNENNPKNVLEGTKFAWREEKEEGEEETDYVDVTCPYGERLEWPGEGEDSSPSCSPMYVYRRNSGAGKVVNG